MRPPRDLQELTLRVERAAARLSGELDRAPTVAELAAVIGTTDEHVMEALQARAARADLLTACDQTLDLFKLLKLRY